MDFVRRYRKWILVSIIGLLCIICIVCFAKCDSETENTPIVDTQVNIQAPQQKIHTSNKSWAHRAWMGKIPYEDIEEINFVKQSSGNNKNGWLFDGVKFYKNGSIIEIVVNDGLVIKGSLNGAFAEMSNLKRITGLEYVDVSETIDISGMFKNCTSLETINIKCLNTQNVLFANSLFENCLNLTEIDMTNMDFCTAINMSAMFKDCQNVESIKLPNTRDVEDLSHMFENVGITSTYTANLIGELNTEKCKNMSYMFKTSRFTDYEIAEKFKTPNLQTSEGMFYECDTRDLDLSNWETSQLITTANMFYDNMGLMNCNLSGWDMSSLKDCSQMFYLCTSLQTMNLNWINIQTIENANAMFRECCFLTEIDVSKLNGIHIGDAREMFSCCERLTHIYGEGFTADVSDRMFLFNSSIESSAEYSEDHIDASMANTNGYFTAR